MNALLICPDSRPVVRHLGDELPLALLAVLGTTLVESWLVHLAGSGVRKVRLLSSDRIESIRAVVGNGARWGLEVELIETPYEFSVRDAMSRFGESVEPIVMDQLPGDRSVPLFESYQSCFDALCKWISFALTPDRIGVREIRPNVFVGQGTHIPRDALLIGPCWIGSNVRLGSGLKIGPMVVVEDEGIIQKGAQLSHSLIGPESIVGRSAYVFNSMVFGNLLIDWQMNSAIHVTDAFLLGSLQTPKAIKSKPRPCHSQGGLGQTELKLQ
ncbi:MAG: hypothetical protein JJU20_09325 [Opitutales bacterium]|nr:hypothetical protein [Opitutales bacterium]